MQEVEKHITLLGQIITPETVREVIQRASTIKWGTHLLRWRYFDVHHEGVTYHRNVLIPTSLWHLLKRVYVDQDWPIGTSQEDLNHDARTTIQHPETEIYVYGYYRTDPPLIATVFKPEEGALFFARQIDAAKIERKEWNV